MSANQQTFSIEEKARLEKVRLHLGNDGANYPNVEQLLDEEKLNAILDRLVDEGHFPNSIVAGSQFMKRYGLMTLVSSLYAFTMWNKPIVAAPDQLAYRLDTDADSWMMNLVIRDEWRNNWTDRTKERAKLANELINENLAPIIEAMVKATKLSATILWENAAIYLFWLYETVIPTEGDLEQKRRGEEDFHYFLREFNCTSFTCGANPFLPYYSEKTEREEGLLRIRKTCCLKDQISSESPCCKTCPKARG
ncbi:siderophore-iron reductase FhuF [Pseudalkalibacillus hwajinpoensis]|uniref:Siderophore-iron reductase FhuF n=1 Tax=Guptibacillus hwajinpoensis TaxID=208199 RepID=A0A4U1MGV0_9BACL|nr:siderophore-iron reductase FhuF [Pseudalkalibacillus hwajinpoensis]TKD70499.1 siderophore-iron reductase FhuF [Pseudalkalibacillus hwajinpoensis]